MKPVVFVFHPWSTSLFAPTPPDGLNHSFPWEARMHKAVIGAAGALAAIVAGLGAATPAAAATAVPAQLRIVITPLGLTGSPPGKTISATLTCDPIGGTHSHAAQACKDIAAAKGDIAAIPPQPMMGCLAVWQPVSITVRGTWSDKTIDFSGTDSNASCARISHGYVFDM
jgi:hypothetical protein